MFVVSGRLSSRRQTTFCSAFLRVQTNKQHLVGPLFLIFSLFYFLWVSRFFVFLVFLVFLPPIRNSLYGDKGGSAFFSILFFFPLDI